MAVGTCAAFGGIPAAEGNQTGAVGLKEFMEQKGITFQNRLLNCPSCPVHPESVWGTLAYVVAKGYPEVNPKLLTPNMFYAHSVHDKCPRFHYWEKEHFAKHFGEEGCLFKLGCLGPLSHTNCPQAAVERRNQLVHSRRRALHRLHERVFCQKARLPLLPQGRGISPGQLHRIAA